MNLARFPRRRHTAAPTPIEKLARLSARLGGPEIWIKRDDLTGLTGGGNKIRKLDNYVAACVVDRSEAPGAMVSPRLQAS